MYADVSDAKYPEEENRGAALLDAAETAVSYTHLQKRLDIPRKGKYNSRK